jgi:hypothetical protein
MRGFISILLILICLLAVKAEGDTYIPLLGDMNEGNTINFLIRSDYYDGWIYVDGGNTSLRTPHELLLKPGIHTLALRNDESICCKQDIEISHLCKHYIDVYIYDCRSDSDNCDIEFSG